MSKFYTENFFDEHGINPDSKEDLLRVRPEGFMDLTVEEAVNIIRRTERGRDFELIEPGSGMHSRSVGNNFVLFKLFGTNTFEKETGWWFVQVWKFGSELTFFSEHQESDYHCDDIYADPNCSVS